ncbi:hypothetical protein Pcinc_035883 [Petrolisthes cinctipes]|uniref:Uncharacterized protein n=1 Tax=Petrolisthes cinctipes TaxID=88211 RepID=A0AAE1EMI7_PETCI|nr:hypothetical protein Pcinc_035883 [Petrolisthes cinctipes]
MKRALVDALCPARRMNSLSVRNSKENPGPDKNQSVRNRTPGRRSLVTFQAQLHEALKLPRVVYRPLEVLRKGGTAGHFVGSYGVCQERSPVPSLCGGHHGGRTSTRPVRPLLPEAEDGLAWGTCSLPQLCALG